MELVMSLKKEVKKHKSCKIRPTKCQSKSEPINYRSESEKIVMLTYKEEKYDLDENILKIDSLSNDKFKCGFLESELPFFTTNNKILTATAMKYIFSDKKDIYLKVVPSSDPHSISNKIPQEFDYKIYKAIQKVAQREKSNIIIITIHGLLQEAGIGRSTNNYRRAKDAIERLKDTTYTLNGCYYNAKLGKGNLNEKFNLSLSSRRPLPE